MTGISFTKKLGKEMGEDRVTSLAAELAYYFMLSIFPLLILVLSILPYLSIDKQQAVDFLTNYSPGEIGSILQDNVISIISEPQGGLLTVGILGTLWSASNGMMALMRALNLAYDVEETRSFIKARLLSILLTIGFILVFIVTLVLPVFGDVIINTMTTALNLPESTEILFRVLRWVVAVAIMASILAALYHFAPNKNFPFKEVIVGAIVATIGWQIISLAFSFYVSNFGNYSATYGSLGGVIILMLWFYLTGIILLVGGEVNALLHKMRKGVNVADENEQIRF
ncbi:YihY/virulence factor BrkB family protein [Alkalihalobacillus macyae]|uniref:YihY/virulence factor BrkB family protein n=1 Tax=Guptibacillus hwajinpoensis TaxID=208199 RepID=UPI00273BD0AD|nr:YihY/virulence factor BrkB family protein [Alkalihalobacillus macyae]MDP4550646.1 YihY/virulence factor BrkB family protein [Alkalihalobacillus macyae]